MADILKTLTSNLIQFTDGERPSASKFNALTKYFNRRVSDISRSIGDVYDDNTIDELNRSIRWNHTDGKRRPIDILNLARIIGPASNLNTRMFSERKTVNEEVTQGSSSFKLSYEVASFDKLLTTVQDIPVEALTKLSLFRQTNSFTNENQYYYDSATNSLIFAKPTEFTYIASYDTDPNTYFGGANYINSQFNVIPDPNATTDKLTITKLPNENNAYEITLPLLTEQQSGLLNSLAYNDKDLNSFEFNKDFQIKLPDWMWNNQDPSFNLEENDLIVSNAIYLKDRNLNESYLTASYYYINNHTIKIKGVSLCIDESHDFALITVGTDITTSIDDLRLKWFRHTHDGTFGEERIDIKNLAGIFLKEHKRLLLPNVSFSNSSIEDNHLPMYLHRIGYTADTSTNNGNNSMLGTLLMSRIAFDYQDVDNQPVQSKDGESWPISFGGVFTAPYIKRDSDSNLLIKGQVINKTDGMFPPNVNVESSNNINSTATDSIINTSFNIFEKATNIYDDYKTRKEIRYENGSQQLFENQEYYSQTREPIQNTVQPLGDEYSLRNSSNFSSSTLFDTKSDITIWKDHSDIQVRKDIENTYTLQPKKEASPDSYRPNLSKINNDTGTFEWLVYSAEVYKNGDTSNKIGCPAIGYKNLNIKEYILPIEDDNFVLEYKDEIELHPNDNFELPWQDQSGEVIKQSNNHTHVISFGEFQQLAPEGNDYTLTTQQVLREGMKGNQDNDWKYLNSPLRKIKYISNGKRKFNNLNLTNFIIGNLKETGYPNETLERIEIQTVMDTNGVSDYKYQAYGEILILEGVDSVDWSNQINQGHDYWKFRNGIFTHGYFSFEQEENDNNDEFGNITKFRKYPKALINENFAIYVKNTETSKIYWLKPYFVTYDDFNMQYVEFQESPVSYKELKSSNLSEDTDPYYTKTNYDYTVLGNTIRFHIRPSAISENNFNSFLTNKDDYQFILVHSFENEQNTHQTHDKYTYIENNSSFTGNNSDTSWYVIQQSNNNLYYSEDDDYSFNKGNVVRYADFKGHIKNAQYRGIQFPIVWTRIDNKNYLLNITSNDELDLYNESDRATLGYYPIEPYLYSLPYGKEYIHRVHNQDNNPTKPKINRWKDYGENSQYITILRKIPDQVGETENITTRRFKIKALNDGDRNKEIIKFNFINFDYRSLNYDIQRTASGTFNHQSYRTITDKVESSIEWLNIPNFVINYNDTNVLKSHTESDFYFDQTYCNVEDSTYLNSNGSLLKPVFVKINNQTLGKQYKKDVNLSIYLKKYITLNFFNFALLPIQDLLLSKPRNFSNEKLISSFNVFKKTIFSNNYFYQSATIDGILTSRFDDKWAAAELKFTGGNTIMYRPFELKILSDILNYIYSLNFILDVKETIDKDSISLDIDFKITNLEVDRVRVNENLTHII